MKVQVLRSIALFLLGLLTGAGLVNTLIGSQVDYLTLANKNLQERLVDKELELQKQKEIFEGRKQNLITAIEIYLLMDSKCGLTDYEQFRVEMEVSKKVKEWLSPIIGMETARLDSLVIPGIVDNREVELDGNKYRLGVHLIVVNQKTSVYVKTTLLKNKNVM